jgi:hypothetical protein
VNSPGGRIDWVHAMKRRPWRRRQWIRRWWSWWRRWCTAGDRRGERPWRLPRPHQRLRLQHHHGLAGRGQDAGPRYHLPAQLNNPYRTPSGRQPRAGRHTLSLGHVASRTMTDSWASGSAACRWATRSSSCSRRPSTAGRRPGHRGASQHHSARGPRPCLSGLAASRASVDPLDCVVGTRCRLESDIQLSP